MTTTAHPPLRQTIGEARYVSAYTLENLEWVATALVESVHAMSMDADMEAVLAFLVDFRNQAIGTVDALDCLIELTKLDRRSVN